MSGTIIEGLLKRVADIEKERDEAYAERDLHIRAAGLMGREIERLMGLIDALTANPALNSADQYARLADTLEPAVFAPTDAAQARPAWLSNCVVCGRIVDTRETDEGGDGHGCEYAEGWTCSSDCAERLHPDPDWMKEGLAAQAREAAMQELIDAYADIIDYGPLVLAKKDQWERVEAAKEKLGKKRA